MDANGNPISVNVNGVATPIFESATRRPHLGTVSRASRRRKTRSFTIAFPEYVGQLTLTLPLRNRSAQAEHARALLTQRQMETQAQQLRNTALLDVRNTYIALTQDRAQVAAAMKARELQQQTFDAEQKKYQLGASTVYTVIQTQRDLITAQGTRASRASQSPGGQGQLRARRGPHARRESRHHRRRQVRRIEREHSIPGTLHGKVIGTEELFKSLPDGGSNGNFFGGAGSEAATSPASLFFFSADSCVPVPLPRVFAFA